MNVNANEVEVGNDDRLSPFCWSLKTGPVGAIGKGPVGPCSSPTSFASRRWITEAAARVNADRLRREMLMRGWNGVDLAYRAGVTPATVSHAMRGLPISSSALLKLAVALSSAPVIDGAAELLA